MTIALVGKNPIDWARPDGCSDGFEPRQMVTLSGNVMKLGDSNLNKWGNCYV